MSSLREEDMNALSEILIIKNKVLYFSDKEIYDYLMKKIEINLLSTKYEMMDNSAANRLKCFLGKESDYIVHKVLYDLVLLQFIGVQQNKIKINDGFLDNFKKIQNIVLKVAENHNLSLNSFEKYSILFNIHKININIFNEINEYLYAKQYKEAFKKSIDLLENKIKSDYDIKSLHDIANWETIKKLLKTKPIDDNDKNYCMGIVSIFSSLSKFRNIISHPGNKQLDENYAMHYIFLASLAYHFIDNELVDVNNK